MAESWYIILLYTNNCHLMDIQSLICSYILLWLGFLCAGGLLVIFLFAVLLSVLFSLCNCSWFWLCFSGVEYLKIGSVLCIQLMNIFLVSVLTFSLHGGLNYMNFLCLLLFCYELYGMYVSVPLSIFVEHDVIGWIFRKFAVTTS